METTIKAQFKMIKKYQLARRRNFLRGKHRSRIPSKRWATLMVKTKMEIRVSTMIRTLFKIAFERFKFKSRMRLFRKYKPARMW
jgi:hypothetical protein